MCGIASDRSAAAKSSKLVQALGNVLKEADLQTNRHDALLTMHHKALITVDEKSKMMDEETEKLKRTAVEIAQYQQQAVSETHHGFWRSDQEGSSRDQTLQTRNEAEMQHIRGELDQLKAE